MIESKNKRFCTFFIVFCFLLVSFFQFLHSQFKDFDYVYLKKGDLISGAILGFNPGYKIISENPSKTRPALLVMIDKTGSGNNKMENFKNIKFIEIDEIKYINFLEDKIEYESDNEKISNDSFTICLNDNSYFLTDAPFSEVIRKKKKTLFIFLKDGKKTKIPKSNLARMYFPEGFSYEAEWKGNKQEYKFKIEKK
jgi:hypothetical protein